MTSTALASPGTSAACHFLMDSHWLSFICLHITEAWSEFPCIGMSCCVSVSYSMCSNHCGDLEGAPVSFVIRVSETELQKLEAFFPTPKFSLHLNLVPRPSCNITQGHTWLIRDDSVGSVLAGAGLLPKTESLCLGWWTKEWGSRYRWPIVLDCEGDHMSMQFGDLIRLPLGHPLLEVLQVP